MTGIVKSFSPKGGYGFIEADEDYFFHASEWMGKDRPMVGDKVDFLPGATAKGKRAYIIMKEIKDGK